MKSKLKDIFRNWAIPPGFWLVLSRAISSLRKQRITPENKLLLEQNKHLLDRHKGARCFILAAGRSIANQDLKKLAGEYVISVGNTFVHEDYPIIKPQYHVLPHILHGHGSVNSREKYAEWLRQMEERTFEAEMFFHIGDKPLIDENNLFSGREIHWNEYIPWDGECYNEVNLSRVPSIQSVSEIAITVALYLGFDEIYLLGFDHDWFNGVFNYFYDEKTQHLMQPDISKIPNVDAGFQMRRHADIFKKYKCLYQIKKNIYNANANAATYVDTFPRVNYDSLFVK